jgi:hypothetical protein
MATKAEHAAQTETKTFNFIISSFCKQQAIAAAGERRVTASGF